jgi:3D-(3,5/4)-trihydroxycyclohexane-1,2-dione acylhydrolase (decyclizing)
MVGDGGYLMMPTELATAVQEHIKVIVVLVQNHGFHSIGSLSEELGSQRFGTSYRYRDAGSHRLDGDVLPVDLAANARSLGAHVIEVTTRDELEKAVRMAKEAPDGRPIVIHVTTDPLIHAPDSQAWWDVPVSQVAELDSTRDAYDRYLRHQAGQRPLLAPADPPGGQR